MSRYYQVDMLRKGYSRQREHFMQSQKEEKTFLESYKELSFAGRGNLNGVKIMKLNSQDPIPSIACTYSFIHLYLYSLYCVLFCFYLRRSSLLMFRFHKSWTCFGWDERQ